MNDNLWVHQKKAVEFMAAQNPSLLYAGMGSGKTLIALELVNQYPNTRNLIITPKAGMHVYSEDATNFGYENPIILSKGSSKDKAGMLGGLGTFVINYETAWRLPLHLYLWDTVILDEGHKVSGHNSNVSIGLSRMLSDAKRRYVMTGTPIYDGYEKLYGIFRFMHPVIVSPRHHPRSALFGSWYDFLNAYCHTYEKQRGVPIITGYKNISQLIDKVRPFVHRIRTEDVVNLPELVTRTYKVKLKGDLAKAYKQFSSENVIDLSEFNDHEGLLAATHILPKLIRLQQLATSGQFIDGDITHTFTGLENRIDVLKMLLEQLNNEPIVIFTSFKRDVEIIKDVLNEPVALLTGDVDTHEEWKQGSYRILIANMQAGSTAVRLERARHTIYWSVGYSNTLFEQSLARTRRPGQKSDTVYAHFIVSENTIDDTIYNVLKTKNKQVLDFDKGL